MLKYHTHVIYTSYLHFDNSFLTELWKQAYRTYFSCFIIIQSMCTHNIVTNKKAYSFGIFQNEQTYKHNFSTLKEVVFNLENLNPKC